MHKDIVNQDDIVAGAPWPKRAFWQFTKFVSTKSHRASAFLAAHRQAFRLRRRLAQLAEAGRAETLCIGLVEHIGDIVAAEPIVRQLKADYPLATLFWVVNKNYAPLLETHPHIDEIIPVQCFSEWIYLSRHRLFSHTFDLHVLPRSCSVCEWTQTESPFQSGEIAMHNCYDFGNLLEIHSRLAGLVVADASPRVHIAKEDFDAAERFKRAPYIVIHTLSRDSVKDWPASSWHLLLEKLLQQWDGNIIELGSQTVLAAINSDRIMSACGKLTLRQTAALIQNASLFIGIDSALAHMANAAGIPGVVLMAKLLGFTDRVPYSGRYGSEDWLTIVRSQGVMSELSVEQVHHACIARLQNARDTNEMKASSVH